MKSTGIIRKVDELGRVVIPIEIRTKLNIAEKDPIEIYVNVLSIFLICKKKNKCIYYEAKNGFELYVFYNSRPFYLLLQKYI